MQPTSPAAQPVAVIADIVDSRTHADRTALQMRVETALASDAGQAEPQKAFIPTVGDEFQAVYSSLPAALSATFRITLMLDPGTSLRFGMGVGAVDDVASSSPAAIQDGPGWWRAREAVEHIEERQQTLPNARTWVLSGDPACDAPVNAYLLLRDRLVGQLNVRARGYALGATQGRSQAEIAEQFGVSQSAVSQALRRGGAAELLDGLRALQEASAT